MCHKNLYSDDYLTKARAFVELTWEEEREELLPVLRNIILNDTDDEWRLRALEVFAAWEAKGEISKLENLYYDWDPVIIRGFMWFVASVGEVADILDMLTFAASPKGRIIRPETTLDLITQAVQKNKIKVEEIYHFADKKQEIIRFISGWDFQDDTPRLLTIYPSADYLALRCQEKDIPFKKYKKIHYRNYIREEGKGRREEEVRN